MSPGDDRVHGGDSLHGALNSVPKVADLEIGNEFRHDISSGGAGPRRRKRGMNRRLLRASRAKP